MAPADEERQLSSTAEEERRKARLWLGYSADNLRSKDNVEVPVPEPQSGIASQGNSGVERPQREAQARTRSRVSRSRDAEIYNPPDDYANLNELGAPSPVAQAQNERQQGYLEDRRGNDPFAENLDGVAASSPLPRRLKEQEKTHLEDRHVSPSTDGTKVQRVSQQRTRVSRLATEIYTISYLIFFSTIGTLARLGLQALTFYPGAPVQTGLLWANVGGSFFMGFLSEDRKLFQEEWGSKPEQNEKDEEKGRPQGRSSSAAKQHAAVKKTIPLYIGLATGFCGSFTSFSSFMRDAFFALSNALHVPISHPSATFSEANVSRNGGYSFLALLAVLITTTGLSLIALQFGAHTALFLEPFTPSIPYLFARKIIDRLCVCLGWGCWLGATLLAIFPPDRPGGSVGNVSLSQETWRSQALFALVFAPLGCLLRFYVSLHLNGRIKAFPLGTFAVNVFGTAMEAMFLDLQRVPIGGMVGCQILQGMVDGFCGCLTTVSTWVAELTGLRLRHAYTYGLVSVAVGLSSMVIIMGSLQWTRGYKSPLCMS
ncbi:hypothetical protein MMC21_002967 [Puttea exsequens]|nr:hypothetical protein [Puttea exsequens]